jgi:hypothetical protein
LKVVKESLLATRQLSEQADPETARIHTTVPSIAGQVIDAETRFAVDNVEVVLDNVSATTTDSRGVFFFRDIPEGPHSLTISHGGYTPKLMAVSNGTLDNQVSLSREFTDDENCRSTLVWADDKSTPAAYVPVSVGGETRITNSDGSFLSSSTIEVVEVSLPRGRTCVARRSSGGSFFIPAEFTPGTSVFSM